MRQLGSGTDKRNRPRAKNKREKEKERKTALYADEHAATRVRLQVKKVVVENFFQWRYLSLRA